MGQLPAPSQVLLPPFWIPAVHDMLMLQVVPTAAIWQLPEPSHAPVLPQGGLAVQYVCGLAAVPAGRGEQVPGGVVPVQVWQPPAQALLQHTP